jgi:hypothetical protein
LHPILVDFCQKPFQLNSATASNDCNNSAPKFRVE